jgi:hypothetical protein
MYQAKPQPQLQPVHEITASLPKSSASLLDGNKQNKTVCKYNIRSTVIYYFQEQKNIFLIFAREPNLSTAVSKCLLGNLTVEVIVATIFHCLNESASKVRLGLVASGELINKITLKLVYHSPGVLSVIQ